MIFDGKPLDNISDSEILSVVRDHLRERQHLEFKVTINLRDDQEKLETLKDITSLANGGGGYLIVGIRDDGRGKAQKFEPTLVGDVVSIAQSIRSLCMDHIAERIEGLEVRSRAVDGNPLVLVRVPDSERKPHMVTMLAGTHFSYRYDDGKRSMTLGEIRQAFTDDSLGIQLHNIDSQLASIGRRLRNIGSQTSTDAGTPISLLALNSGDEVAEQARLRFENKAGDAPLFWLSITPQKVKTNLVSVDQEKVREILRQSPGSRHAGWNMEDRYSDIVRFGEGVRRGNLDFRLLELYENGHMEFWTPIGEEFCWKQTAEERKTRPRLWPFPVVEFPATFLRLYAEIVKVCGLQGPFIFQGEYRNIEGFVLPPYAPTSLGFMLSSGNVKPYTHKHLILSPAELPQDFIPDDSAFAMVQRVYANFGNESDRIPFFKKGEGFIFPPG